MKTNDKLFSLIKRLNQSEKRYFKRFSKLYSSSKKNNYLTLFEILDKLKTYDVKVLMKNIKKDKFSNNLSVTKDYLFKLILKSMRSYYDTDNIGNEIMSDLVDVNFLMRKSFIKESKKLLEKTKNKAILKEKYTLAIESMLRIRNLHGYPGNEFSFSECANIKDEQLNEINRLKNYCEYLELEGKYKSVIIKNDNLLTNDELNFKDKYSKLPLLTDPELALSNNAKFLHYYINIHKLWVTMNFYEYYAYCNSIYHDLSKLVMDSESKTMEYLKYLRNLILSSQIVGDDKKADQFILKFKSIPIDYSIKDSSTIYYCEINYYKSLLFQIYFSCNFDSLKFIESEISSYLQKNEHRINIEDRLDILFITSILHFINKNYTESIRIINSFADNKDYIILRKDVILISYTIRVLSYYENNETEYLVYHLNSILKKLKVKNSLLFNKFTILIKYFKKLISEEDEIKLKEHYYVLRNELEKDLNIELIRKRLFNIYFVINWLNSKLNNIDFSEELKNRHDEIIKSIIHLE